MPSGTRHPDPSAGPGGDPRRGRLAALTLGAGVGVVIVFALVFSVAFGTKGVAGNATSLHHADEALRAATVARSQAGLAVHLSVLQRDFGFQSSEAVEFASRETRLALDDLAGSLAGLERSSGEENAAVQSAASTFRTTTFEMLSDLEDGDVAGAETTVGDVETSFRSLMDVVILERDELAARVAGASALMGRIGDASRFLVAFLVPTTAILVYRGLSRRQQQRRDLEFRLKAEQELGQARDEFVANASHELRTPLTSIFGLAHVLEEDAAVASSDAAKEMVGLIISETTDLSRMVDDLLTTARLDAGALHYQFENINVLEEVREVVEPVRRSGAEVAIEVPPALVRSDRLRLRQVLRNLLSNARKYGGPRIRVRGSLAGSWYELRVEDDGEGIPKQLHERLFSRFLHRGSTPLVLGSVGLGLSIVRALTEGMGGAVWYERGGGWTGFVVKIPLAVAPVRAQSRAPAAAN